MKRTTIVEIISLFLLSLFLYAAISKIMDYTLFKEQLSDSPIMKPIAGLVAWSLPTVEFIVVLLLLVPRWRLRGLYASLGLLIVFTIYIVSMLAFSDHLPCSCGGLLEQLSWKQHVIFNAACIALAYTAIRLEKRIAKEYRSKLEATFG